MCIRDSHSSSCVVVSRRVMAVARMASVDDHAVRPTLERPQNKHRIYTAGARNPYDFNVCRIGKPARPRKVRPCITAPVTAERYDKRFKFALLFFVQFLHIASTSAIICLLVKPFKSIAPEGQVTVHAPQPWQTASFTHATLRTSRTPWSLISFST